MQEQEILELIEGMSEDELQEILDTDFGDDLQKQASAELDSEAFADALYAFGAYSADREIAEQDELAKEASAEFDQVGEEIAQAVEAGFQALAYGESEDQVWLQKEAAAAAAIIWDGYVDQIEKVAGIKEQAGKVGKFIAGHAKAVKAKGMKAGKAVGKHVAKHGKKYSAGAGVAAGAVALEGGRRVAKKGQQKHASEAGSWTQEEIEKIASDFFEVQFAIEDGLEKVAARGKAGAMAKGMKTVKDMGKKMMGAASSAGKHVAANKKGYGAGAAAAVGAGAAGYAAGRSKKRD